MNGSISVYFENHKFEQATFKPAPVVTYYSLIFFRQSNPNITDFMKQMNITGNYDELEAIYIQKVLNISKDIGFSYVTWQEVFDNGVVVRSNLK